MFDTVALIKGLYETLAWSSSWVGLGKLFRTLPVQLKPSWMEGFTDWLEENSSLPPQTDSNLNRRTNRNIRDGNATFFHQKRFLCLETLPWIQPHLDHTVELKRTLPLLKCQGVSWSKTNSTLFPFFISHILCNSPEKPNRISNKKAATRVNLK